MLFSLIESEIYTEDCNYFSLNLLVVRNNSKESNTNIDFLPAGARAAYKRLVLRLLYVFRVCLFVCASALITCAIYYVIRYYATAVYSNFWRFAGQATANEGGFVLPRWRKRGR